jgi:long-chain acyl-CoA synthetase
VRSVVWVFDVDGCIIDSLTGTSLRPGARELLQHLRAEPGSRVVVWSAGGDDYARRRARALDIEHLADAFHNKEHRDDDGRYRTDHFLPDPSDAVFVDDRPEDLPVGARVIAVSPYLAANPHDRGLDPAARFAGLTHG